MLRNQSLIPLRQKGLTWALWIDIDNFFNKSPDSLFSELDGKPMYMYNDIRVPSLRFWSLDKIMGDTIPYPQHWGLLRLSALSGFVGSLHEQALLPDPKVLRLTPQNIKDFWLGHYDLAKLNKAAVVGEITLARVMGLKKLRYLAIRKLTGSLSPTDPDPDLLTDSDIEKFGWEKIDEELFSCPLSNFPIEKHSLQVREVLN